MEPDAYTQMDTETASNKSRLQANERKSATQWSASRPAHFTPSERSPWCPLDRRLGGPQSRPERGGEEKNSQPPPGIGPYKP
jgi:hypothetical protein